MTRSSLRVCRAPLSVTSNVDNIRRRLQRAMKENGLLNSQNIAWVVDDSLDEEGEEMVADDVKKGSIPMSRKRRSASSSRSPQGWSTFQTRVSSRLSEQLSLRRPSNQNVLAGCQLEANEYVRFHPVFGLLPICQNTHLPTWCPRPRHWYLPIGHKCVPGSATWCVPTYPNNGL